MEFKLIGVSAVLTYNSAGWLVGFALEPADAFTEKQYITFAERFPFHENNVNGWKSEKTSVRLIPPDLSFETFYKQYNQKLGKKPTAEAIWNRMPETEKIKAINFVQLYDQQLLKTGFNKKNCETYLNQKPWNN